VVWFLGVWVRRGGFAGEWGLGEWVRILGLQWREGLDLEREERYQWRVDDMTMTMTIRIRIRMRLGVLMG